MNAGFIITIALFILIQILDPEGNLNAEYQVAIGGLIYTVILWLKTRLEEQKKEEETKSSAQVSSPSIG